jgi:hypothetical protein
MKKANALATDWRAATHSVQTRRRNADSEAAKFSHRIVINNMSSPVFCEDLEPGERRNHPCSYYQQFEQMVPVAAVQQFPIPQQVH